MIEPQCDYFQGVTFDGVFNGGSLIYKVLVDDNFHYQDESERITEGVFATADEALAACRAIVDEFLADAVRSGMSSEALFDHYTMFGEDPFIVPIDDNSPRVKFSAWDHARQRCLELACGARERQSE